MARPSEAQESVNDLLKQLYNRATNDANKSENRLQLAKIVVDALNAYDSSWTAHLTGSLVYNCADKFSDVDIGVEMNLVDVEKEAPKQVEKFYDDLLVQPLVSTSYAERFDNAIQEAKQLRANMNELTISSIDKSVRDSLIAESYMKNQRKYKDEKSANSLDPLAGFNKDEFIGVLKNADSKKNFRFIDIYVRRDSICLIRIIAVQILDLQHELQVDITFSKHAEAGRRLSVFAHNGKFVAAVTVIKYVLNKSGCYGGEYVNGISLVYLVLSYMLSEGEIKPETFRIVLDKPAPTVTISDIQKYQKYYDFMDSVPNLRIFFCHLFMYLSGKAEWNYLKQAIDVVDANIIIARTDQEIEDRPTIFIANRFGSQENCAGRIGENQWDDLRQTFSDLANEFFDERAAAKRIKQWLAL